MISQNSEQCEHIRLANSAQMEFNAEKVKRDRNNVAKVSGRNQK